MPNSDPVEPVGFDFDLPPELLTMQEAADRLRLARSSVYELVSRGELATLKVGKRRLILVSEVARFIAHRLAAEALRRSA
jgi:excisionase family DNA binding protein